MVDGFILQTVVSIDRVFARRDFITINVMRGSDVLLQELHTSSPSATGHSAPSYPKLAKLLMFFVQHNHGTTSLAEGTNHRKTFQQLTEQSSLLVEGELLLT